MIVLDTTTLVYAKGSDHGLRGPCRQLIEAVEQGRVSATTSVEVVQEFAYVRSRRRGRSDAAELARDLVDLFSPLLVAEEADLREGLRLFEQHPGLGLFDAVLAAASRSVGATALVSGDTAFSHVSGLRHVVPDETGVASLLEHGPGE